MTSSFFEIIESYQTSGRVTEGQTDHRTVRVYFLLSYREVADSESDGIRQIQQQFLPSEAAMLARSWGS